MFNGMNFKMDEDGKECTCTIYRKDREHPIEVTEYLSECKRSTGPWGSHPRRMLRHKAMIQCARIAFGYVGIYDQDEAERIVEGEVYEHPAKQKAENLNARLEVESTAKDVHLIPDDDLQDAQGVVDEFFAGTEVTDEKPD